MTLMVKKLIDVEIKGCLDCPHFDRSRGAEEIWYCLKNPGRPIVKGNKYQLPETFVDPECFFGHGKKN